jgi:hypothetical protein
MIPAVQAPPAPPAGPAGPTPKTTIVGTPVLPVGAPRPSLSPEATRFRPEPAPVAEPTAPAPGTAASELGKLFGGGPAHPSVPSPTPPPSSTRVGPRPAAPAPFSASPTEAKGPWAMDALDALMDDVDAGFGAILGDEPPRTTRDGSEAALAAPPAGDRSADLEGARALFADLAIGHVRPVRDFMIDLRSAQARTEWVGLCLPTVRSLRAMAAQLDQTGLCALLDRFASALDAAGQARTPIVEGAVREALEGAYAPLVEAMPGAFALDEEKGRRDAVIVQSLLLQVPGVRKVTIDKLYAAGLSSLDVLHLATPREIAETTGIDIALAKAIAERFERYRDELAQAAPDAGRSIEHAELAKLAERLRAEHAAFEAAESTGDLAKKRDLRKAREGTVLQIKVLMARLGQTERVAVLDKVPFAKKLDEVERYLDEVRSAARS